MPVPGQKGALTPGAHVRDQIDAPEDPRCGCRGNALLSCESEGRSGSAYQDAERAIEVDPDEAAGYLALSWVQINRDWDWEGAELSLNKAAELEPGAPLFSVIDLFCVSYVVN